MKKTKDWTYGGEYITTVESETEDKSYDIHRLNGQLVCDCAGYRFSRTPKDCKHLRAYRGVPVPVLTTARDGLNTRVTVGKETFTLHRRAISFNSDLR